MVSESIDFAFEDMNNRVLTETRMKSEELLPAVEMALQVAGEKISETDRSRIENAAEKVKQLLESETPDLEKLQQANAELDEATQDWRRCWSRWQWTRREFPDEMDWPRLSNVRLVPFRLDGSKIKK